MNKKLQPGVKFSLKPENPNYNYFLKSQPHVATQFNFEKYHDKVESKFVYLQRREWTKKPVNIEINKSNWVYEGELLEGT